MSQEGTENGERPGGFAEQRSAEARGVPPVAIPDRGSARGLLISGSYHEDVHVDTGQIGGGQLVRSYYHTYQILLNLRGLPHWRSVKHERSKGR